MKKSITTIALLSFFCIATIAQQKPKTAAAKPKTASGTAKPVAKPSPKPKTSGTGKVDIVGAAVSKDSKGTVVSLANKEPFKFYTDPDKELLTIEFTDPAFKNSDISISDNDGKPVKQVQLEGNQTKINVNTQRWENGIYVIVLTQHTTQQTIMQKIVLNR